MSKLKGLLVKIIGTNNIKNIQYNLSYLNYNKFKELSNQKKILLSLIPTHGNLGDHAIAYASIKYLKDKFPDYEIIEVNFNETYKYGKAYEKIINKDDLVCIIGGGNMGNQYMTDENIRRLMKKSFTECKVIKNPDMVFYLNNKINISGYERKHIMTCLRKDKETYVPMDKKEEFLNKLKENFKNVIVTDTVVDYQVSQNEREKELFNLWAKFYNSKVVITDRLHGMIFCAITKTPCIVTRSLDHKVIESYKWIKNLNYIRLVEGLDFDKINPIIEELSNLEKFDELDFDKLYFDKLICKIM